MRLHFCILQVMEGVVGRPRNEASKCREKSTGSGELEQVPHW